MPKEEEKYKIQYPSTNDSGVKPSNPSASCSRGAAAVICACVDDDVHSRSISMGLLDKVAFIDAKLEPRQIVKLAHAVERSGRLYELDLTGNELPWGRTLDALVGALCGSSSMRTLIIDAVALPIVEVLGMFGFVHAFAHSDIRFRVLGVDMAKQLDLSAVSQWPEKTLQVLAALLCLNGAVNTLRLLTGGCDIPVQILRGVHAVKSEMNNTP
jgi:hypothetical protein